jgi:tryptophan synthase alpha chain
MGLADAVDESLGVRMTREISPLESYIREKRSRRDILLMTHIVIGYPDIDTSLRLVETMVAAGVELIELQVPFSEPIADGPVILHANQEALIHGMTVEKAFGFAREVTRRFDVPFLFMTYYNVVFRRTVPAFVARMREAGLMGAIVPDLPPEEAEIYLSAMSQEGLSPVFIFSPRTSDSRLQSLGRAGSGLVYCVARKGVTGRHTAFTAELEGYLARARAATELPLAVGFGVQRREDVDFLRGKADIAVVGSEALRVFEREGVEGVGRMLSELR